MHGAQKFAALAIDTADTRKIDTQSRAGRRCSDGVPAAVQFTNPRACEIALEGQHQLAIRAACCNSEHLNDPCVYVDVITIEADASEKPRFVPGVDRPTDQSVTLSPNGTCSCYPSGLQAVTANKNTPACWQCQSVGTFHKPFAS
jgi:hypothetical protein